MVLVTWSNTEIKSLSIDPQIKSAHNGYRDQAIRNKTIQH